MRSNYKRLGDYIEPCGEKNDDNIIKRLRGISNQKYFQKAKTNTIGIDLSKYRIVRTGQFAFNRATTRNGDKISIALNQDEDCIVSPSYRIFKSKDESILNSEYLMMWFRRPEFDRYARFMSHGSAHEFFDYGEMCEVKLPVPYIEKQREIVAEYNTVVNRIKLNEQLNQKLEETAQAIYRHWFVDFQFPNENGQPYKSSGGKMAWNEELKKDVPEGWEVKEYEQLFDFKTGKLNSNAALENGKYPFFTCSSETFKTDSYSFDCEALILAGNNARAVYPFKFFDGKFDAYQRTYVITPMEQAISIYQGYFEILNQLEAFKGTSSGTATKFLTMKILNPLTALTPVKRVSKLFDEICNPIFTRMMLNEKSMEQYRTLASILLSRMTQVETEKEREVV